MRRRRQNRSLYQRGLGYNYEATKIFMPAGSKQPVVVHYQGSTFQLTLVLRLFG